ncbi:MAG: hypothetical protein SYR96_39735, partial [Actinomycetota bacterium]|nr:hypothetical protein [Actinomycetota bacterium]
MSSYEAVKTINNLQKYDKPNMITKSFEIYSNLDETQKNEFVIVALLKCCKQMIKKKMDIITMNVINDIKITLINTDNNNIFAKRLLMSIYTDCKDITNALKIFDSIPQNEQSILSIGTMMKQCINHNKNDKAILIYEQYNGQHNDVSDLLFIKACTNIGDADKGIKLIKSITNDSIEFTNSVINFYGKIGDVNNAVNTFNNIPEDKKDIVTIGAMMKCFIDNYQNEKAISIYEQYNHYKYDDISNTLFIKACTNIGDADKGIKLIKSTTNDSIEFTNSVINFYGKIGDV